MKRKYLLGSALLILFGSQGCKSSAPVPAPELRDKSLSPEESHDKHILHYTCSMHPFIKQDHPGRCPICGMELVPVYAEASPAPESQASGAVLQLSDFRQQLIGVKSEAVTRGPLLREIETVGRVAYDPGLYVAQSDYLLSRRTGGGELGGLQGGLVRASRSRLQLLGMSDAQIRELEGTGKPQSGLLLPQSGKGVWIYGSVFENDLPWIKLGNAVQVQVPGTEQAYSAELASVDPTIDPTTRTARVRLKLSNASGDLRPDMFLKLRIRAGGEEGLRVPSTAVLATGKRDLVYVDRGGGRFEAVEVKLGRRGTGAVEVLEGLKEGDRVVTQGNFLLDSESSLQGLGTGGHSHGI